MMAEAFKLNKKPVIATTYPKLVDSQSCFFGGFWIANFSFASFAQPGQDALLMGRLAHLGRFIVGFLGGCLKDVVTPKFHS